MNSKNKVEIEVNGLELKVLPDQYNLPKTLVTIRKYDSLQKTNGRTERTRTNRILFLLYFAKRVQKSFADVTEEDIITFLNGKLAESNITNFSKPKQDMSLWVPCGVAYESDLKKVEKISIEVAKEIQQTADGAVRDFEPVFRYREFGDSNINFITVLRVSDPLSRFVVRNEFIKALKERFDKENIEISWPIRKIYQIT